MFNALQDIDRLSQIVRALLLLSQAESGQLALQKSRLESLRSVPRPGGPVSDSRRSGRRPAHGRHAGRCYGRGRPRADRAHDHQPALQRHQVHAAKAARCGCAQPAAGFDQNHRGRHRARASPPNICPTSSTASTVSPGRGHRARAGTGLGPGSEFRRLDCQSARWQDRCGQHPGKGTRFTIRSAAPGSGPTLWNWPASPLRGSSPRRE